MSVPLCARLLMRLGAFIPHLMKKGQKLDLIYYLAVNDLVGRHVALLQYDSLRAAVRAASGLVSCMATYSKVWRDFREKGGAFAGVYLSWPCGLTSRFTPQFVVVIHSVERRGLPVEPAEGEPLTF